MQDSHCTQQLAYMYLSLFRPSSLERMKEVEGVSEVWLRQYGSKVLQKIDEFCKKRGESVRMDVFPVQTQGQPQELIVQVKANTPPVF